MSFALPTLDLLFLTWFYLSLDSDIDGILLVLQLSDTRLSSDYGKKIALSKPFLAGLFYDMLPFVDKIGS